MAEGDVRIIRYEHQSEAERYDLSVKFKSSNRTDCRCRAAANRCGHDDKHGASKSCIVLRCQSATYGDDAGHAAVGRSVHFECVEQYIYINIYIYHISVVI